MCRWFNMDKIGEKEDLRLLSQKRKGELCHKGRKVCGIVHPREAAEGEGLSLVNENEQRAATVQAQVCRRAADYAARRAGSAIGLRTWSR